jgi:1-deoxy-D-xylulose 5-phosphate reductoisomerase
VEYEDGGIIAQLGVPDMRLPIQYALTWPDRCASEFASLDFYHMSDLHCEAPDLVNFPSLALAMDCAREGGTAPCIIFTWFPRKDQRKNFYDIMPLNRKDASLGKENRHG